MTKIKAVILKIGRFDIISSAVIISSAKIKKRVLSILYRLECFVHPADDDSCICIVERCSFRNSCDVIFLIYSQSVSQVLQVNKESQLITLTNKKTFVQSSLPTITGYQQLNVDDVVHAYIKAIKAQG